MGPSFNEQFHRLGKWRHAVAAQLSEFGQWLQAQQLQDAAVQNLLQRWDRSLRNDKVGMVFVSEFSRGKSELINAVFFAHYGQRIMPAAPGRTTMCTTELGYDPCLPPCLRLLPVETRAQPYSVAEWRSMASTWVQLPLDVSDPQQLAQSIAHVAQVRKVSVQEAKDLGFWSDVPGADNPSCDAQGLVEIPQWRHAIINMAHPLLEQGLIIVDTPGLNAVGTEPELTVNLIAQAQAVLFLLAANEGVTAQDVSVWQSHLQPCQRSSDAQLVVLNKVDALREMVAGEEALQKQVARLQAESAQALDVDAARVIAVSARDGWDAKLAGDQEKLRRSGLPQLEDALAQRILAHHQRALQSVVNGGWTQLQAQLVKTLEVRRSAWQVQLDELQSLHSNGGDTARAISVLQQRLAQERLELEAGNVQIATLRNEHLRLMHQAFQHFGVTSLRKEMDQLAKALAHSGLEVGVRHVYASAFERLREQGDLVKVCVDQVQQLLATAFEQLNTQLHFALKAPTAFSLHAFEQELARIEEGYLHYLDGGYALKLAHPLFGERMVRVLGLRLHALFEATATELDLWSQSALSQLHAQWQERKQSLARRAQLLSSVEADPQHAAQALAQTQQALSQLQELELQLRQWMQRLHQTPSHLESVAGSAPKAA